MNNNSSKGKQFSRRSILPLLGSSFLLPFLVNGQSVEENPDTSQSEEFETLLKADGTIVKVKSSSLKKGKVIKKNMSNKSLLKWLGK